MCNQSGLATFLQATYGKTSYDGRKCVDESIEIGRHNLWNRKTNTSLAIQSVDECTSFSEMEHLFVFPGFSSTFPTLLANGTKVREMESVNELQREFAVML